MKQLNTQLDKIIFKTIDDSANTLTNMTLLKGITNMFSGQRGVAETFGDIPVNFIQQLIPTAVGQISKTIDPYKRETYDPNYFKKSLNSIVAKTPASTMLPAKQDIYGNDVLSEGDNIVTRALFQGFSPGTYASKSKDKATLELSSLYKKTQDTSFLPRIIPKSIDTSDGKQTLSVEQKQKLQKEMGQNNFKNMSDLVESRFWNKSDDDAKIKALKIIAEKNYNNTIDDFKDGFETKTKGQIKRIKSKKLRETEKIKKEVMRTTGMKD